ncbi:hypothetical protein CONPUDRAFT_161328 [Coniophora puteana RWD-64-598 SS2]|uniref:BZIP domain-containing protein n=1 Tax=Coniophora puteana (strain RWD-64-598) TaxID=741705 RepID=A0A5M3N5E9_CONPW|nr:uncharacterized protein CONPUDRAFT_161328 [Coniophora puteana RWD-64-598 SS2]EIW86613.1 hypothetical protein CONPUDRAFT_161328 [Coniophora puteana RWD-64-598 SS2]
MSLLNMVPIGPSPLPQEPSTPPSSLWATASKEWVIPAKPKPGRKPKKEASASPSEVKEGEDGEAGRRVQNRAAQRAFRERKQTQLAELQARIQQYEQGEIEKNVALQNVAKKMKEENEELRRENQALKEKLASLEQEREIGLFNSPVKKRSVDEDALSSQQMSDSKKRARFTAEPPDTPIDPSIAPYTPSDTSMLSPIDPSGSLYPRAHPQHTTYNSTSANMTSMLDFPSDQSQAIEMDVQDSMESARCVLCNPAQPCVCMSIQSTEAQHSSSHAHQPQAVIEQHQMSFNSQPTEYSILDNLPAYQEPVPLRRRAPAGQSSRPVFPVSPVQQDSIAQEMTAQCSGDPSNCMACADDQFGQAFCQAIGQSVSQEALCSDCPRLNSQADAVVVGDCCGNINRCGSCGIAPMLSSSSHAPRLSDTIPTNDAWRQIKSHPNVDFTDLSLLAEVVARRSQCPGSRVITEPTQYQPPSHYGQDAVELTQFGDPGHSYVRKPDRAESPPRLVPQKVLIECGRRRMREVNMDGVREALRLLDAKFGQS